VELSSTIERDKMRILKTSPLVAEDATGADLLGMRGRALARQSGWEWNANVSVRGLEPRHPDEGPGQAGGGAVDRPGLNEMVVPRRMQSRFAGLRLGQKQTFGGGPGKWWGLRRSWLGFDSEIWVDVVALMQATNAPCFRAPWCGCGARNRSRASRRWWTRTSG